MAFEKVYIVHDKQVQETEVVYDKDGNEFIFSFSGLKALDRSKVYNSKLDARYATFIYQMKHGSKIQNFKSSKYFSYYYERAMEENPEFLI